MYTVSAGGCNARHQAPFTMERPKGISEYLLLFIRTKAAFEIDGHAFPVEPNQMLLIDKNLPYRYTALENSYIDDWMHFDCLPSEGPALFPSMLNTPIILGNASRVSFYMQQVLWEFAYASDDYRCENITMLMNILMNHIRDAVQYQHDGHSYLPYYDRLQEIRLQFQSNPGTEIDLTSLCQSLSISTSYFQHLYTRVFGISFRNDLIAMRINYAKYLLAETDDKISHIAMLCGYHNEIHFYRQFRNIVGMTPNTYRQNMQAPTSI